MSRQVGQLSVWMNGTMLDRIRIRLTFSVALDGTARGADSLPYNGWEVILPKFPKILPTEMKKHKNKSEVLKKESISVFF